MTTPVRFCFRTAKGLQAYNPQDFYITDSGLYIADTDNNRILLMNTDFQLTGVLDEIRMADGQTSWLNRPEGIYVYPEGDLLIADTQNQRIVRCDIQGNAKAIIEKPEGMTGISEETEFYPTKVACDSAGRINVVAKNINLGILQLDSNGVFLSYIGAPPVQPDLFTLFWRRFSTQAQEDQMLRFVATEYSNIFIDSQDFMWGTISTMKSEDVQNAISSRDKSGTVTPIRKLNSMGDDILRRNGQYAPLGDLSFEDTPSRIIDVAVGDGGIYSLLDLSKGRIFTYDDNGNLLYVFGNYGLKNANLQLPSAIGYIGDRLVVLDAGLGMFKLFEPTQYGRMVLSAVREQYAGNYDEANAIWTQIAEQNTNFEYAFQGLGNAQLSDMRYEEAMDSFKYANDPEGYSEAFVLYRKQAIDRWFSVIFAVILGLIAAYLLYRIGRKFYRYYKGL